MLRTIDAHGAGGLEPVGVLRLTACLPSALCYARLNLAVTCGQRPNRARRRSRNHCIFERGRRMLAAAFICQLAGIVALLVLTYRLNERLRRLERKESRRDIELRRLGDLLERNSLFKALDRAWVEIKSGAKPEPRNNTGVGEADPIRTKVTPSPSSAITNTVSANAAPTQNLSVREPGSANEAAAERNRRLAAAQHSILDKKPEPVTAGEPTHEIGRPGTGGLFRPAR